MQTESIARLQHTCCKINNSQLNFGSTLGLYLL